MFTALLDTCILVPSTQRDVLLECASAGIYRPVWSQAILDELTYTFTRLLTLKGRTADEVDAYVTRLRNQMRHTFPDALTTGWDHLLPTITIPDPGDTHVVAAALTGGAQLIVTNDRRGFTARPRRASRQDRHARIRCGRSRAAASLQVTDPDAHRPAPWNGGEVDHASPNIAATRTDPVRARRGSVSGGGVGPHGRGERGQEHRPDLGPLNARSTVRQRVIRT